MFRYSFVIIFVRVMRSTVLWILFNISLVPVPVLRTPVFPSDDKFNVHQPAMRQKSQVGYVSTSLILSFVSVIAVMAITLPWRWCVQAWTAGDSQAVLLPGSEAGPLQYAGPLRPPPHHLTAGRQPKVSPGAELYNCSSWFVIFPDPDPPFFRILSSER